MTPKKQNKTTDQERIDDDARRAFEDADLERFHDGDLDGEREADLRSALFRDAALRNRLAEIRDVDATIRDALAEPSSAPARSRVLLWRRVGAAAAMIAIAATSVVLVSRNPKQTLRIETASTNAPAAPAYEPVRVVLSVPVHAVRPSLAARPREAADELVKPAGVRTPAPNPGMSELVRSAMTARAFLDDLSPSEQLAVSRDWAVSGTQPAVAFARLRELSDRPELRRDVHTVLAELATDDRLASWLRSYRLTALMRNPESMPSRPS